MNWSVLLAAIMQVESGGQPASFFNPIRGDDGKAFGTYQIHKEVILDVNRLYSTNFQLHHADSASTAKNICQLYLVYWGARYEGATGRAPTYEVYARIWNGGPKGYSKNSTEVYWAKVKKEIDRIEGEVASMPIKEK